MKTIAVFDYSTSRIHMGLVPADWDSDRIDEYLRNKGHKETETSWIEVSDTEILPL